MELREYIAIFRKNILVFWFFVVVCAFVSFVWQRNQVEMYDVTLLLNIGRAGIQSTQDYTYDSFYRLQADERFADTVVRWLGAPRIVEDIYAGTGLDAENMDTRGMKRALIAKRLSSQVIEVSYATATKSRAREISQSAVKVLNHTTESLNTGAAEPSWFVVIGSDPVVRDGRMPVPFALMIGLVIGAFVGFWGVYVRHYFRPTTSSQ